MKHNFKMKIDHKLKFDHEKVESLNKFTFDRFVVT